VTMGIFDIQHNEWGAYIDNFKLNLLLFFFVFIYTCSNLPGRFLSLSMSSNVGSQYTVIWLFITCKPQLATTATLYLRFNPGNVVCIVGGLSYRLSYQ
jgi:hypothetical protein